MDSSTNETVPSSGGKGFRSLLTVIMDLLVVVAVADVIRLVIMFFGELAAQPWAQTIIAVTDVLVLPLGMESIKTPYGGVFDVNAAITVVVLLIAEWLLSVVRSRA